jgi:hypothetical protein
LTTAPFAALAGIVMTITLRFRPAVWLGWTITLIGTGLFLLLTPTLSTAVRVIVMMVMGIGTGILFPALQFSVQAGQPDDDVAYAVSTFVFFRSLGNTFGVAIGGVIFQNQWNKQMAKLIAENAIPTEFQVPGSEAEGVVLYLNRLPSDVLSIVKGLYSDSLRSVWIFFIPLAAVALLASLFMRDHSLDKVLNSKQMFDETREPEEESHV